MIFIILGVTCLLTCVVEALYLLTLCSPKKWIRASLVCNVLTNLSLNMIYPAVDYLFTVILYKAGVDYALARFFSYTVLVLMEIGIVFLEAWIYGFFLPDTNYRTRLAVSAKVNACSFAFGLLISSTAICSCRPAYYF